MTKFEDGPAKGEVLMLKRSCEFLRVTRRGSSQSGQWDALDCPEDKPAPEETLYAYTISNHEGMAHLNFGGGRGGFYPMATYKFLAEQPDDATMRDNVRWKEWCAKHSIRSVPDQK